MVDNHDPPSPIKPVKSTTTLSVAVALQSDKSKPDSLPKIIASGRGKLAEQILELAFAKGVKVREDADLAELLATLDLDTPIPSEAIIAVAEILARVYEANAKMKKPLRGETSS
jgi:flagellar biosynthesis protein